MVYDDGTLRENGTYVNLAYRCAGHRRRQQAAILADNWDDTALGTGVLGGRFTFARMA